MSDEHDSWFKDAFGVDLGQAAQTVKDQAVAAVDQAKSTVTQVVQGVQGAVEGALDEVTGAATAVVKKVAGAVSPSGAGGVAGAGGGTGSFPLGGSVGRGGKNGASDVRAVQSALGITADGQCGGQTIAAIEAFQRKQGQPKPDGRVDAGGATERALASGGASFLDKALKGAGDLASGLKDLGGQVVDGVGSIAADVDPAADLAATNADSADTQAVADRILAKMKAGGDLRFDLAMLGNMDMRALLDVMQHLKRAGKLDELPSGNQRVGVAMLTIRADFNAAWRKLVAALNEADRKAVLERTPKNVQVDAGLAPAPAKEKGDGEGDDGGGSASISPAGVDVQAKLEFQSKAFGFLGKAEFSLKLGADGKLSEFEVGLTPIKTKLEKLGKLGPILDLEASLSLNASAELDQRDTQVIFNGVQANVKGEVELRFKQIPALRKVRFKLTATAGSGGVSVTGAIEITIPGT